MRRILIADDEPHVIRVLQVALERAGFEVEFVPDGEKALARITDDAPDALITDIQMPRMSGEDLCRRLHQDHPEREYPIFVMTSRPELEHREWSRAIPDLVFLEKPISVRNLVSKLTKRLGAPS
jgi:CheY-like chemotaxis protein